MNDNKMFLSDSCEYDQLSSNLQQQFTDEILGTGLLLYLSPIWLSELYHQIIDCNLLAQAGYIDTLDDSHIAIIEVLTGSLSILILYFS